MVKLHYSYQSDTKILFIIDFIKGGDLFQHLSYKNFYHEAEVRFISAQLIIVLSYLHSLNVIYRDLKLENILIDERGYIKLIDFGISKQINIAKKERTYSLKGTEQYMAPEMLNKKGYSFQVDWWALGTIMYEMLTGLAPFIDEDTTTMFKNIQKSKLAKPQTEIPITKECFDLLEKLLNKDPLKRLGNNGSQEILNHPFFKGIDI